MHRTTATLKRPERHVFVEDPDVPRDHKQRRFCRCALREDDALHIPAEEFYEPTPTDAVKIDHRRIGESE